MPAWWRRGERPWRTEPSGAPQDRSQAPAPEARDEQPPRHKLLPPAVGGSWEDLQPPSLFSESQHPSDLVRVDPVSWVNTATPTGSTAATSAQCCARSWVGLGALEAPLLRGPRGPRSWNQSLHPCLGACSLPPRWGPGGPGTVPGLVRTRALSGHHVVREQGSRGSASTGARGPRRPQTQRGGRVHGQHAVALPL